MLLKDIERKIDEKEIRKYGIDCYEENCDCDDWIDYLNENGSGVYSIESSSCIIIKKVVCEKLLNSKLEDVCLSDEELDEMYENGNEVYIDYFYYKK